MDNVDIVEEGISICIAAYHTIDYIKATLDSIAVQSWFEDHDNYEIIVCCDGDTELAEYMAGIMGMYKNLRVILTNKNVGSYVASNTAICCAKYANILRFDSDDIMYVDMIETLMKNKDFDFITFNCFDIAKEKNHLCHGSTMFKKDIFKKFGGYKPWPCGADSDYMRRIKSFVDHKHINSVLFGVVSRSDSLTHGGATKMGSPLRQKYMAEVRSASYATESDAYIKMVTEGYKEIVAIKTYDTDKYLRELRNLPPIVRITRKIRPPKRHSVSSTRKATPTSFKVARPKQAARRAASSVWSPVK